MRYQVRHRVGDASPVTAATFIDFERVNVAVGALPGFFVVLVEITDI
jgi:hypothetical protein